jgi:UDP-3-O-[3-hydroxymyristoyl] glucosamine N-acyltransferase
MQLNPHVSLSQVAGFLQATYEGDPSFPVSGINEIHRVEPGDLTFVDHPKYYDKALLSKATTIIINKKVPCPEGKSLIFSDDPFRDFVALIKKYRPFIPATGMISETATIGKETIIQPGVFIGNDVIIGNHCLIHPNVSIYDRTIIGDHVIIHSGTVIGSDALYFKRRPDAYDKLESGGRVVIEDRVEIGAGCTIDRGVTSDTRIGSGTKFDNHIHIGHDTVVGKNCLFAAQVGVAGCVNIEDDVILWGQVGVQKDLTIGKGAIVLGKSGVSKSLSGGITYWGIVAKPAKEAWREMVVQKNLPKSGMR